ncbi:MAG: sulfotransferase family protein [Acetobacteraceae bacterium]
MQPQPLFIIGAPRSGTTFLCNALNRHRLIQLTNESRMFVLLKEVMERCAVQPDLVGEEYQQAFLSFMYRNAGGLVEQFYRETLGFTAPIWGDKHPPYADPTVLSGRTGSQPHLPLSGSCLPLIRALLPSAKFLHIQRAAEQVGQSLVRKGWTPSLSDGVNVWHQYIHEIETFFSTMDARYHLTIAYDALLAAPEATVAAIGRFLSLPDWGEIEDFLIDQHTRPTPFSGPTTDLTMTYDGTDAGHPRRYALSRETAR